MSIETQYAKAELTEMYRATIPFLDNYQWEFEDDRWGEMVTSLFSGIGTEPAIARRAVELLQNLDMLTPRDLAELKDEEKDFIHGLLIQAGMNAEQAMEGSASLLKLCAIINKKWNGYIQKLLRTHAATMITQLQQYLVSSGIEVSQSKRIATVWLQNVCNLPVLLEGDPHIVNFCSRFNLTESALLDTLDELGLNASLADDLMALYDKPVNRASAVKKKNKAAKKKRIAA